LTKNFWLTPPQSPKPQKFNETFHHNDANAARKDDVRFVSLRLRVSVVFTRYRSSAGFATEMGMAKSSAAGKFDFCDSICR
jgi:hypothetical protein